MRLLPQAYGWGDAESQGDKVVPLSSAPLPYLYLSPPPYARNLRASSGVSPVKVGGGIDRVEVSSVRVHLLRRQPGEGIDSMRLVVLGLIN